MSIGVLSFKSQEDTFTSVMRAADTACYSAKNFALDDFGSGMSSFGYLKSLPIYFLKIDGIFIRELLEEPVNSTIVKSFHQVAQMMGIATIAEFVDSESKFLKLQSLGIDYAQGYWIAKPQSFPQLKLLTNRQDVA
ncbi:MAG: GGDEF domain-containing phosphodiesterase [Xenococcaceae cyanobacterium MO_188.B32]|nr:GGDEF domain-containing phosphodiesterase [Xenococcaceae cyanobacterium MO_188.B32]